MILFIRVAPLLKLNLTIVHSVFALKGLASALIMKLCLSHIHLPLTHMPLFLSLAAFYWELLLNVMQNEDTLKIQLEHFLEQKIYRIFWENSPFQEDTFSLLPLFTFLFSLTIQLLFLKALYIIFQIPPKQPMLLFVVAFVVASIKFYMLKREAGQIVHSEFLLEGFSTYIPSYAILALAFLCHFSLSQQYPINSFPLPRASLNVSLETGFACPPCLTI
jgi:hypothetical protein